MGDKKSVSKDREKSDPKIDTVTIRIIGGKRFRRRIVNRLYQYILYSDEINFANDPGVVEINSTLESTLNEEIWNV